MKKLSVVTMLMVALPVSAHASSGVKQEIIDRCKAQMNQYGAAMVKACVDKDIKAFNALVEYPDKYNQIVGRCMSQMREYGFSMVKACVDKDIKAEKALEKY